MRHGVRETERKYEAGSGPGPGPGASEPPELPDLSGLPGVAAVRRPDPELLDAVYYDTPDLALASHRRTLRRRTGGHDAGWHLKLPTAEADTRTEVRVPLDPDPAAADDTPPAELRTEVTAVVRGRPLAPVVRLRTTRRPVLLLDAKGRTLAEIAHDEVTATLPGPAAGEAGSTPAATPAATPASTTTSTSAWTEVEVELDRGGPALLDAVEDRLTAAGLRRSASPSKLTRALGDRLTRPPQDPDPPDTAGRLATAYLRAQFTAVLALDPEVRRAAPYAVHRMRVATRRARSALRSFRRELDPGRTGPLGDELKWLAGVLGLERDREVLTDRLALRLAELGPATAADRTVRERLRLRLPAPGGGVGGDGNSNSGRDKGDGGGTADDSAPTSPTTFSAAHAAVLRELDGPRYFALLDAFEALLAAPPFRPTADAPAHRAATATVRRDHARLRRRVHAALDLPPGDDRDTALHDARKAAKRARYSGEAAESVLGAPAAAHTSRMKSLQQLLGDHQDSVMCRRTVTVLREQARAAGEDPAPYDAIAAREQRLATAVEVRLPAAWQAAERTG
jgi:CHAD domain-containing protein